MDYICFLVWNILYIKDYKDDYIVLFNNEIKEFL